MNFLILKKISGFVLSSFLFFLQLVYNLLLHKKTEKRRYLYKPLTNL